MESAQQDGLTIRADVFRYSVVDMEHWLPLTAICHALPYACRASDVYENTSVFTQSGIHIRYPNVPVFEICGLLIPSNGSDQL